jgi:hypothetical protein
VSPELGSNAAACTRYRKAASSKPQTMVGTPAAPTLATITLIIWFSAPR